MSTALHQRASTHHGWVCAGGRTVLHIHPFFPVWGIVVLAIAVGAIERVLCASRDGSGVINAGRKRHCKMREKRRAKGARASNLHVASDTVQCTDSRRWWRQPRKLPPTPLNTPVSPDGSRRQTPAVFVHITFMALTWKKWLVARDHRSLTRGINFPLRAASALPYASTASAHPSPCRQGPQIARQTCGTAQLLR